MLAHDLRVATQQLYHGPEPRNDRHGLLILEVATQIEALEKAIPVTHSNLTILIPCL